MSVRLALPLTVPEPTAVMARSVFQCGSPYLRLRDALTPVFFDVRFANLFSNNELLAEAPWRLAIITMLQFTENLSDRRAAEAVRNRIDWKYLLGLELADPGFNSLVLSEFRHQLVAGDSEAQLLDVLLITWREQQLLTPSEQPSRTLMHVLTAVCAVNRLSYMIEATQAARHALAGSTPEGLCVQAGPVWAEHHVRPVDDYQIPRGDDAREAYATQVGRDAYTLMGSILELKNPIYMSDNPNLRRLSTLWWQNFRQVPEGYRLVSHGCAPKKPVEWVFWRKTNEDFPITFQPKSCNPDFLVLGSGQ